MWNHGCNHIQFIYKVPKAISGPTMSPQSKAQTYHSLGPAKSNLDFNNA